MGKLLGYYLLIINAAGFLIMCVDKLLAKKEARRVPERTLLLIAAIGGSLGSLLGMPRRLPRLPPSASRHARRAPQNAQGKVLHSRAAASGPPRRSCRLVFSQIDHR